jgi:hypothetical protein
MSPSEHDSIKIDLTTFFLSIASAAYMGLGIAPRGTGEKSEENLSLAKQNIDLLELMQAKTKGNRTAEEDRLIEQLLFELRMRFVEKTNHPSA